MIDHKEMAVFLVFSLNKKKKYRAMVIISLTAEISSLYVYTSIHLFTPYRTGN